MNIENCAADIHMYIQIISPYTDIGDTYIAEITKCRTI